MSPDQYAISGYYTSFSSLISPLIIFYLIHYYIKEYFRLEDSHRSRLFAMIAQATIWFSGIVAIVCYFGLLLYLTLFHPTSDLPISPYLGLMVFALPLTGLYNLQLAKYRMSKNSASYFRLSVSNGIIGISLSVIFVVWMKLGAFGKLLAPLVCNTIVFTFLIIQLKNDIFIKIRLKDYKPILIFCLPLAVSSMLGYFTHGFTTTYLESVGDVTEYGIYVVGNSMGLYLSVFGTAVGSTFQPDLYETTIKRQWKRFIGFCLIQVGLISLIVLLFVILAPYIISILTAGRYIDSTPYARIISLSTITSSIYYITNNFSIATNRPKLYLYTSILGSIFIIICTPVAVNYCGFYGGAWINVLSYLAFTVINITLIMVQRKRAVS